MVTGDYYHLLLDTILLLAFNSCMITNDYTEL